MGMTKPMRIMLRMHMLIMPLLLPLRMERSPSFIH